MLPSFCDSFSAALPALIEKCTRITSLKAARQIHASILVFTSTTSALPPYLHNNLISMYARCGSVVDSRKVFDRMPQRNIVSYNALITAYSKVPRYAFWIVELWNRMGLEGFRPNGLSFTRSVQACSLVEDTLMGLLFHSQVVKFGFCNDIRVQTSMVGMYSSFGDLESAKEVFGCVVEEDAVAWNSMIFGCLKNERVRTGLHLFSEMLLSGVSPTEYTYSMILNACGRLGYLGFGRAIHAFTIVSYANLDLPMQNALLDMYCSCGDIATAWRIFNEMENRCLVSWNSMISGFSDNGDAEMAVELFYQLNRNALPKPDEYTFAVVISATAAFIVNDLGKPLHGMVIKKGLESSLYVGSTLVSMYFSKGENDSAETIFYSLPKKDVVLWTEMITAHTRLADGGRAVRRFCDMFHEGHMPDSFALSGTLSACADLAILRQGEMIHSLSVKMGYEIDMFVCGSLVDMYSKNGHILAAEAIFSRISVPDLKCWNSILGGYGHHGMASVALELFDRVLLQGLIPDQVTFLTLLSACNHGCMVEKGKYLWNYMKEYGIRAGPKHYSCMISLLCRAGLLEEAEEMIWKSPFYDGRLELWRTLLSSCVNFRNLVLGVHAAEQGLSLDAEDTATYVLLGSLYAAVGRWNNVAEVRRKIRGLMMEKEPGLSWIEAQKDVHMFSSGDQSHPDIDESQYELHRLRGNMIRPEASHLDEIVCNL